MSKPEHIARMQPLISEVKRAISTRKVTNIWLAEQMDMNKATISNIRMGKAVPSATACARLADVLNWPGLVTLSTQLRTKHCSNCGQEFVDSTNDLKRMYCNRSCHHTSASRQRRESTHHEQGWKVVMAERKVKKLRAAIAAHCAECSLGSGICHDASCHLQRAGVSPIPLERGEQWEKVRQRFYPSVQPRLERRA